MEVPQYRATCTPTRLDPSTEQVLEGPIIPVTIQVDPDRNVILPCGSRLCNTALAYGVAPSDARCPLLEDPSSPFIVRELPGPGTQSKYAVVNQLDTPPFRAEVKVMGS